MEDYKQKYELGSIVTAKRTPNGEIITGVFGGFRLFNKSNPKSIVGVVHTSNRSYDVEPNSIESVISQDERIKNGIIQYLEQSQFGEEHYQIDDDIVRGYIVWLEKQGKIIDEYEDKLDRCACESFDKGYKAALEKQGKQTSADKKYTFNAIPRLLSMVQPTDTAKSYCQKLIDILIQEGYDADAKIVGNCLKQMNGEKVAMATMDEQNPACSEEDENVINHLLAICTGAKGYRQFAGCLQDDITKYQTWLKSLKERKKNEQKTVEPVTVVERDGEQWVRVRALGEDFIIAAHDYRDGDKTEFTWEEACNIGTFSKKQGYIILALLDKINAKLEEIGGEPLSSYYWSSSEYGQDLAWGVHFNSGLVNFTNKCYSFVARAVAAF